MLTSSEYVHILGRLGGGKSGGRTIESTPAPVIVVKELPSREQGGIGNSTSIHIEARLHMLRWPIHDSPVKAQERKDKIGKPW